MKRYIFILLALWMTFALAPGDVAADYYLPLQVGNRLTYRASGEGWYPRTVHETIEDTDSLFGKLFYKQVGTEFLDNNPTVELIFHVFWLREDSAGTVMIGATGLSGSRELDSAMIYPYEYPFFHSGYLQQGYCQDTVFMGTRYHDSVLSVTETVETGAGTFHNCINRRIFHTVSPDSVVWHEYEWFAKEVGMIKDQRMVPDPHITLLQEINFQTDVDKTIPASFSMYQNYPNPFNPLTTIDYALPEPAFVEILIFDIKGKKAASLINTQRQAGYHKVIWNAMDLASGIYLYLLKINNRVVDHKKMCILK